MVLRSTPFLATGAFVFAGVVVAVACNPPFDEELGNIGQQCFQGADNKLSCDPGLTCVPSPLDGGGSEGGECFPLDAGDESAEDALEDDADAGDAEPDAEPEGGEPDSSIEDAATDAQSDSPVGAKADSPGDAPADSAEASIDANAD